MVHMRFLVAVVLCRATLLARKLQGPNAVLDMGRQWLATEEEANTRCWESTRMVPVVNSVAILLVRDGAGTYSGRSVAELMVWSVALCAKSDVPPGGRG